jgi:hypothetical protein
MPNKEQRMSQAKAVVSTMVVAIFRTFLAGSRTHAPLRTSSTLLAILAACFLTPSNARSQEFVSVSTANGRGADAHVARYIPTLNLGAYPYLGVKNAVPEGDGRDYDRKAYMRFDLATVGTPASQDARLRLHVVFGEGGVDAPGQQIFSVYGLTDGPGGEAVEWIEGVGTTDHEVNLGITWNTAPSNDVASGDGMLAGAELLGTFSLQGNGEFNTDTIFTSPSLVAFLNRASSGLVTLVVTRSTVQGESAGWVHCFASRESPSGHAPVLELLPCPSPTITTQPISQSVGVDVPVSFFVEAENVPGCGSPLAYQWQRRDPGVPNENAPNAWLDLVDGGGFLNTRTAAMVITHPIPTLETDYRCRITGCGCAPGRDSFSYSLPVTFQAACPADFNADGGIDGADVEAFFARWENGC